MIVDWLLILCVALVALGFIQYLKNWFKGVPTWVWAIALPILVIGVAAAFVYLPAFVRIGLLALAIAQLGYDAVFEIIRNLIKKSTGADISPGGGGG